MPEKIVSRILRLPGYGIYAWDTDEAANTLTLSIRQTAGEPYYICGGCWLVMRVEARSARSSRTSSRSRRSTGASGARPSRR